MVTIKDISRECGVSASTVSKVLNGYTDISQATIDLVFRKAEELGYTPNAAARQLKTNRSHNIGVLFVDQMQSGLRHEYFSGVLESVKATAESRGYDITFISRNLGGRPMTYLNHCRYRKCDGVIIASVDFTAPEVLELVNSEIPVVTVDHLFNQRGAVISDNVRGMEDLVTYIHSRGHRSIAFIHGEMTSVTRNRITGFYRTCEKLGLDIPEEYVREARYHDPASCERVTRELLALPRRPSCIIYPDDFSFLGGRDVFLEMGLSIPGDISVAGYDGIHLSRVVRPALTTLAQDTDTLGRRSAEMLIEAIENPRTYLPHQELIPGTLLEGGSVAQIEYAAEMGLEHHLGMTCDPVCGLVQIPCIERNAFAAARALDANFYASLSDGQHRVSFDRIVRVMKQTGHDLPSLYKETSQGGLAKIHR